jgi:hypothetical protein
MFAATACASACAERPGPGSRPGPDKDDQAQEDQDQDQDHVPIGIQGCGAPSLKLSQRDAYQSPHFGQCGQLLPLETL